MLAKASHLWRKRQNNGLGGGGGSGDGGVVNYNDGQFGPDAGVSWWWTPAGMALRYAIVALLFGSVLLFFLIGYIHARRRMRKGLPLLPYHRWMVRNRAYYADERYVTYQQPGRAYVMENYAPPPPAYNPSDAPPPVYQPPEGGSKVIADQNVVRVQSVAGETSQGNAFATPPPAAVTAGGRQ